MVLTDEQRVALKAALDAVRPGTGRPLRDERRTVEGVVWRPRNGARWRSVPAEYGPWWRPAQLHIRWSRTGVWARLFAHLRDAGRPELADVFVDGTVVRAHQKAAGAQKDPMGRRVHGPGRVRVPRSDPVETVGWRSRPHPQHPPPTRSLPRCSWRWN